MYVPSGVRHIESTGGGSGSEESTCGIIGFKRFSKHLIMFSSEAIESARRLISRGISLGSFGSCMHGFWVFIVVISF